MTLYVVNRGDADYTDRFNGVDYTFAVNKPVAVPVEAAALIFGYGSANKAPALTRNGKLRNTSGLKDALAWLNSFQFVEQELVAPTLDDIEAVASTQAPPDEAEEEAASSTEL